MCLQEYMDALLAKALCMFFLLVVDLVWVTSKRAMYAHTVQNIQGTEMKLDQAAAIVAYTFVGVAFIGIVVPRLDSVESNDVTSAGLFGALVGLAIYGIFNATNKAMFSNYDTWTAIIDTIWGTTLFAVTSVLYVSIRRGSKIERVI